MDIYKKITNKRIVSGITPSGDGTLHIGNFLGAVRQFIEIAKNNDCFLFVADMHALTTVTDRKKLEENIGNLILNELSLLAGFGSLTNITFYRQSEIAQHGELQSYLNNVTPFGLLKRAHAYKDKLQKEISEEDINLGLFNYPILMAADILMYKPDLVPVGKDQKQHVEITRDIAQRFNHTFKKNIFKLPEAYIEENVATVLGTDGKRKMSKSLGNIITIFEPEEVIRKQVNSCFTDPTREKATDPGHIEGNMVFAYLEYFGEKDRVEELKGQYAAGKVGDVEVKEYLYDSLLKTFAPARKKYQEFKDNPKLVSGILEKGTKRAKEIAAATMAQVKEIVGMRNSYMVKTLNSEPGEANQGNTINIDDFARVEVRVGKVESAVNVEKSEKLILLTVNFGEFGTRIIYTGVRGYGYTPEDFQGKQFLFVTNLEPRKMPGGVSQGMILAVDGLELKFGEHGNNKPIFVPAEGLPLGSKVR